MDCSAGFITSVFIYPQVYPDKNETWEMVDVEPINQPFAIPIHSFDP